MPQFAGLEGGGMLLQYAEVLVALAQFAQIRREGANHHDPVGRLQVQLGEYVAGFPEPAGRNAIAPPQGFHQRVERGQGQRAAQGSGVLEVLQHGPDRLALQLAGERQGFRRTGTTHRLGYRLDRRCAQSGGTVLKLDTGEEDSNRHRLQTQMPQFVLQLTFELRPQIVEHER
ncbi:hypothetical protein D3C76_1145690 [compost metagenome]